MSRLPLPVEIGLDVALILTGIAGLMRTLVAEKGKEKELQKGNEEQW